jgi:hypothetical protein
MGGKVVQPARRPWCGVRLGLAGREVLNYSSIGGVATCGRIIGFDVVVVVVVESPRSHSGPRLLLFSVPAKQAPSEGI